MEAFIDFESDEVKNPIAFLIYFFKKIGRCSKRRFLENQQENKGDLK